MIRGHSRLRALARLAHALRLPTILALVATAPRALSPARLELDYARARALHAGDAALPPLVELPAALGFNLSSDERSLCITKKVGNAFIRS